MGLLQKACETYDNHAHLAGVHREGHQTLAPVSHNMTNVQIEITIDQDGQFIRAISVDKSEPKIIIPVTEDSAGRTSASCPHPLCDQLSYLAPYDQKKHAMYVEQLTKWAESEYTHPKLALILTYVKGKSILADLSRAGIITLNESGLPSKGKSDDKLMVRWRVTGLDDNQPSACWMDQSLFAAFINFYNAQQTEQALCMISGQLSAPAKQHPKGIIAINGNAKLISANDKSGFTYRGRFSEDWQAETVSYIASQKAHNALRWLASNQGVTIGGRTFLCWNPKGKPVVKPTSCFRPRSDKTVTTPTEYQDLLQQTLKGYQETLPALEDVIIAVFDAATTGRLSLTYYNELRSSDFLARLKYWDETCCWENGPYGIQSPALQQIVNCAFGTQRMEKGQAVLKSDDRVMKQQVQRLLSCRIDRSRMPFDIVQALAQRASSPLAYDSNCRARILFTACAAIRKYRYDTKKEEWEMSFVPNKKDRSYQYGRLLAVMEKVESDTYDNNEKREPNAIRLQSIFCKRPLYATRIVHDQLERAYFPRLKPGSQRFYKNVIGEIMANLSDYTDEELNKPLEDVYLMGYYLQRNELYKSKKEKNTEENENEHTTE